MSDKPARAIAKLTETLRARDAALAELSKLVAQLRQDHREARQSVTDLLSREQRQLDERDQLAALLREAKAAAERRSEADDALRRNIEAAFGSTAAAELLADPSAFVGRLVEEHNAEVSSLQTRLDSIAERETAIASKETELRALVERVDERLRARERQEAAAILNRRILSGAVPGRNRG